MELFLFFTTILQNFSLDSPVASEDIDITPQEDGLGRVAPNYQIRFLSRRGGLKEGVKGFQGHEVSPPLQGTLPDSPRFLVSEKSAPNQYPSPSLVATSM